LALIAIGKNIAKMKEEMKKDERNCLKGWNINKKQFNTTKMTFFLKFD